MTKQYLKLFEAVDADGVELPAEVTERREVRRLVKAAQGRHAATPPPSEHERHRAAVAALLTDPNRPVSAEDVISARAAVEAYRVEAEVLSAAVAEAEVDMLDTVIENVPGIVRALAGRWAQVWAPLSRAVKDLGDLDTSVGPRDQLLRASDKQRKAFLAIQDHAEVFQRLRNGWGELPQAVPELDGKGDHAVIKEGWCTAIGERWNGLPTSPSRPAPPWGDWSDVVGMLIFLARAGYTPWFPLAAERDQEWREVHAEQHAAMVERQHRHWQVHAS